MPAAAPDDTRLAAVLMLAKWLDAHTGFIELKYFPENTMSHPNLQAAAMFEVRYLPLTANQRSLSFPCDGSGRVDLNSLSKRALSDYLFARALVGRIFGLPQIGSVQ